MGFEKALQKMIEAEISKQLENRGIATKGWVKSELSNMLSYHSRPHTLIDNRINSLEKQVRKLFAKADERKADDTATLAQLAIKQEFQKFLERLSNMTGLSMNEIFTFIATQRWSL